MPYSVDTLPQEKWPPLLKEIPDPPQSLFYAGSVPDWNTHAFLAVVGSRTYSSYGKDVCEKLIQGLRGYPITIVSGLALGIDAIAHRSAIETGLPTIAVPGSGLAPQALYPRSHRHLADDILSHGGMLLSEFEPTFKATPWSFPQRNRIMAGMSHAVLVIEATQKSGTLITSKLATEYNRDVFTVPGSIFSPTAQGPHMLIRLGATIIRNSNDILDALNMSPKESPVADNIYEGCSQREKDMLHIIIQSPCSRDDLAQALQLPIHEINTHISILEIKGFVREKLGQIEIIS